MLFIAAYYHPVENLTQQSFVWRCLASCITGKFCSDQSESYQAKCRQMSLLIGLIIVGIAKKNKYICSSESRPLAEGEQAVFLSLFLSAFLPSEILFYFFTQNKGGGPENLNFSKKCEQVYVIASRTVMYNNALPELKMNAQNANGSTVPSVPVL